MHPRADIGLRGWDPDYFDGTGRALANVQWRTILQEDLWHFLSIGAVLFADVGRTWDPRVGPGMDRIHANAGVGLLIDLPRVGSTSLLRVAVGFPDDGSGYVLTVTTSPLF